MAAGLASGRVCQWSWEGLGTASSLHGIRSAAHPLSVPPLVPCGDSRFPPCRLASVLALVQQGYSSPRAPPASGRARSPSSWAFAAASEGTDGDGFGWKASWQPEWAPPLQGARAAAESGHHTETPEKARGAARLRAPPLLPPLLMWVHAHPKGTGSKGSGSARGWDSAHRTQKGWHRLAGHHLRGPEGLEVPPRPSCALCRQGLREGQG